MALCVGIVCLAANSSGNRPSEVGRVPPRARSGVQSDIRISITVCCRLCLDGGALATSRVACAGVREIFSDFFMIFSEYFSDFFRFFFVRRFCCVSCSAAGTGSAGGTPSLLPSHADEQRQRKNGGVCRADVFQLHVVDTYLSDTCQHPMGTRLVVPVLVCFGSPFVSIRCR